jgi:membrane-associated phospholipid phosphatase
VRLPSGTPGSGVARVNAVVLATVSHGLTTFPSGHVAVSAAAAVSLVAVSLPAAAAFGAITVGLAIGAASGRYHYVVDVLAGFGVGLLAPMLARFALAAAAP